MAFVRGRINVETDILKPQQMLAERINEGEIIMATIQGQELCSKVEAFLASGPLQGWVGGKGVEAADG
ncbi:MAG: hypothetical protein VW875_10045, partial [Planctomycetaceae bacterium]